MIDYKELLTKYIKEVGDTEGVDYIPKNIGSERSPTTYPYSKEELESLWECAGWNESKGKYEYR